jgi:hypothetical protein
MAKSNLDNAKTGKKDEFYTQYPDIESEMNEFYEYDKNVFRNKTILLPCDDPEWSNFTKYFVANFNRFGLKKLISTSYASASKASKYESSVEEYHQVTLFELNNEKYDESKTDTHGKIFTLTRKDNVSQVNIDNLDWDYLEGDGDFRSEEVTALLEEADIVVTNPPFSLFKEFVPWLINHNKQFIIIGNQNAITYKEVFPYLKDNKLWLGKCFSGNVGFFQSPYEDKAVASEHKDGLIRVSGVMWFTNIDYAQRHEVYPLMTQDDNIKFNKKLQNKCNSDYNGIFYPKYDNYDAIEVPVSDAIPSDYIGVMGVPITFLTKYDPEQFKIIGATESEGAGFSNGLWDSGSNVAQALIGGNKVYKRIFIKYTDEWIQQHSEVFKKGI